MGPGVPFLSFAPGAPQSLPTMRSFVLILLVLGSVGFVFECHQRHRHGSLALTAYNENEFSTFPPGRVRHSSLPSIHQKTCRFSSITSPTLSSSSSAFAPASRADGRTITASIRSRYHPHPDWLLQPRAVLDRKWGSRIYYLDSTSSFSEIAYNNGSRWTDGKAIGPKAAAGSNLAVSVEPDRGN
ncbi:hypothetical protein B0H67DRAFT_385656 [Lasiosphaeris hirsuta]|uniref:Uncharacterized protein n=1 Tax=Lasiosphaeris hirsuta TaxID=260670 RepID=A0AA39ZXL4_9PEZI|nr:hypothetical protein B0H67DRAFT_385656 [Lasiosphaeris hirsuta]